MYIKCWSLTEQKFSRESYLVYKVIFTVEHCYDLVAPPSYLNVLLLMLHKVMHILKHIYMQYCFLTCG